MGGPWLASEDSHGYRHAVKNMSIALNEQKSECWRPWVQDIDYCAAIKQLWASVRLIHLS